MSASWSSLKSQGWLKSQQFQRSSDLTRLCINSVRAAEKFQQPLVADLPARGTPAQPEMIKDFQEEKKLTSRKRKTFRIKEAEHEKAV